MASGNGSGNGATSTEEFDVVVVGAGFAGLYLLHRLRNMGYSTVVLESAGGVGGTWYWNRYPGARCDIMTIDYSYSFDPELEKEWTWSEKYAAQPEILAYANFVTDRYDLRKDIRFDTKVEQATWDEATNRWHVRTDTGDQLTCQFYVMATGCLSVPKEVDIEGMARFHGQSYFTNRWPHEGVDFTGLRVGVIGTGSSGVQSIPLIAEQAAQLTVFQRTPNYSRPALNGPVPQEKVEKFNADRDAYRHEAKYSLAGVPVPVTEVSALQVSEEERRAVYEAAWNSGDLIPVTFADMLTSAEANETYCEFIREKIRSIVTDPETAETLCPKGYYYGTKRPCIDTNYFETFNLPHVRLVDLRKTPITTITETGIDTSAESFEFDAIVFATGFDAMTGAIVAVDIEGRDGLSLKQKWADGPLTYLGLTTVGFPNLFLVTGPGSPSVLSNMMVSIEQHVEFVSDTIAALRKQGFETIEPTPTAEAGWVQHVNDCGDITLFPKADSWYMGANVPGKPRVFLPYIGGVDRYRVACEEVVEQGYLGFTLRGPSGEQTNDGVIRRVQPDVTIVLELMEGLGLPPVETMSPEEARAFFEAGAEQRPPGPEVGEIVDGTYPGAAGPLGYRLYRPASEGPHPVTVYYHGGGWVLGSADSDDPFCRDLCVRSDSIIVSVDYRHAPEHRFPAPVDDALSALQWVAEHVESLGGRPGPVAVAGWSAGANLAAVVSQLARDAGGPAIAGQLLLTPVTDSDLHRYPSYEENAERYVLTRNLMEWFFDHYVDPADRNDPRVAPLRAADLSSLPPATVITCEFDPLRDEGAAYAQALAAAGNEVQHISGRGHTHTSLTMVDIIISSVPYREQMAQALRGFHQAAVPA
jgi:cation diffusion facilitator CzcD-associated flavoprotein CzcO/acetyl esterase/lipase